MITCENTKDIVHVSFPMQTNLSNNRFDEIRLFSSFFLRKPVSRGDNGEPLLCLQNLQLNMKKALGQT